MELPDIIAPKVFMMKTYLRLLLALSSLVIGFILADRLLILTHGPRQIPRHHFDPLLGMRAEPSQGFVIPFADTDLLGRVIGPKRFTFDARGFRSTGSAVEIRPSSPCRILCIGGSTTLGYRLSDDECYPARLRHFLEERKPERAFEVVNAAFFLRNTSSNLRDMAGRLHKVDAEIVVIMEGFNDIFAAINPAHTRYGLVDPGCVPDLPLDLPRHAGRSWPGLLLPELVERALRLAGRPTDWSTPPSDDLTAPCVPGDDEDDSRARSIFRANLASMVRLARRNGARVFLVLFPSALDASLSPGERARRLGHAMDLGKDLGALLDEGWILRRFAEYRAAVVDVARDEGAVVIDAATPMSGREELFVDVCHLTPAGADALAGVVGGEVIGVDRSAPL